ncbi:hypothetical protein [Natrarchaeobius chitinivorans]|uniref:Uncharacterized protein n=1 Tax=Natrarchaeobius chitinivorans TaxID=1679083 RepID=A0A3N6LVA2_NATCH|nr:hypothetical protein [Natrarchaeobius chitinivorans]RQG94338.1 hypothetical protein EA473_11535 [Natrarchaeobius chitinivorans]
MTDSTARLRRRLHETVLASRVAVRRADSVGVAFATAIAYLFGFLWATNSFTVRFGAGFSWRLVDDPFTRALERRGPTSFEPIAVVDAGFGTVLLAPIDLGIGIALSALVGLNVALAYLALVQPASCGIGAGAGAAAAVPALLSGSVCCAPVVLLVLGIQASGALLTVLPWLLPLGAALLVGSLVYVAGKVGLERGPMDSEPNR